MIIKSTYDDYYGPRVQRWDINDFLDVVDSLKLEHTYGKYLEENGFNQITLESVPELDLGDKPITFVQGMPESSQVFVFPKSDYPESFILRYRMFKPEFQIKRLDKKYKQTNFEKRGIQITDIQSTVKKAEECLKPFRGKLVFYDKLFYLNMLIALVLCFILSIIVGMKKHWAYMSIFIVLFLLFGLLQHCIIRSKSNKLLRQAHFALAVLCRAENNRFYLRAGGEVRPGYLARWVQFISYFTTEDEDSFSIMQKRWQKIKQTLSPEDQKKQEEEDMKIAMEMQKQEEDNSDEEENKKEKGNQENDLSRGKTRLDQYDEEN